MHLLGDNRMKVSNTGELEIYCAIHSAPGVVAKSVESGEIAFGFTCSLAGEALTDFAQKDVFERFKSECSKKLTREAGESG
jgi:hypothetical protein